MTIHELYELAAWKGCLQNEVKISIFEPDGSTYGCGLRDFTLKGISDVGHSDKVVVLDIEEIK